MYERRNEIRRLRLKGFRRIFSRFEKLDALFLGFILFARDALRSCAHTLGPLLRMIPMLRAPLVRREERAELRRTPSSDAVDPTLHACF